MSQASVLSGCCFIINSPRMFLEGGKENFLTSVVTSLVTPFGFFCVSDGVWGDTEFNLKSLTRSL